MSAATMAGALVRDMPIDDKLRLALWIRGQVQREGLEGRKVSPWIDDLEAALIEACREQVGVEEVRTGQEGSGGVTRAVAVEDGDVNREWLTYAEVSRVAGMSVSTLKRRRKDGSLQASVSGRSVRFHRDNVAAMLNGENA